MTAAAKTETPAPMIVASGWQMQDVAKATQAGAEVSTLNFKPAGWYTATVPGTVLTTLVNNHVYPEPLYGENMRPEIIPESLVHTDYWYRTVVEVPKAYKGRHVWLNFDGINYAAQIWVNGVQIGTMRGAFARGIFDISAQVKPGQKAAVAVLISPQPNPGVPHEHTLRNGVGLNGGESAIDGPTFLSTIGWDWLVAIRDRDAGIWQKVFLSATGPVLVKDPLVTTDLPLPKTDSADVAVKATVENITDQPQKGSLRGSIEGIAFERTVELAPHSSQTVSFDVKDTPVLHMNKPRLWWPNGYGPQNLYKLRLSFDVDKKLSDVKDVTFGVRKITYTVPDSENLTISVNGVRVFIRGGNWGLDEGMKRISRERLDAQVHLHQLAGMNMIRNWVGQSTSEDFYEMCDKYGLLLWDEFFQPNPGDGPNPTDLTTYLANVRDKILRFRNHPSIAVWCARNEGYPPKEIDDPLRTMMAELEPMRLYQPSSTDGHGVQSHGPYHWRTPREFYEIKQDFFKTETGTMSVPTLESIKGMMPKKDWETITDDWAQHDFAKGAQGGDVYKSIIESRYGTVANLPDFVRKSQLMNYEAFRAMYEGRNAKLFAPATGVLTWMSNPAQPSFVWQIYHYDLEPNSSLFAVKKAAELIHIQLNEATGQVEVINNLPDALNGATAHVAIYNLDGTIAAQHDHAVIATADAATVLGKVEPPAGISPVYFVKLELKDASGKLLSDNLYWQGTADHPDDLTALNQLAPVVLAAQASRSDANGRSLVTVTLHNPAKSIALMIHVQLRRRCSGERVLPVYASDNYISLLPNESRTITLDAAQIDLHGEDALVVLDGWNATVAPVSAKGVAVKTNTDAIPANSPTTGLPFQTVGLR